MEIELKFNEWNRSRILHEKKNATTRFEKKGEAGDTFRVGKKTYMIDFVVQLPMWFIARELHRSEGCVTGTSFIVMWSKIYNEYKSNELMYYHYFTEVKNGKTIQASNKES